MSWFSGLKKKELESIDFSVLKTDIHSHLIPGIDDGVQSLDESLDLIFALQGLGFSKIITTPHTMSDFYKNTPEIIISGRDDVQKDLDKLNRSIEFEAASEYYVDFDFQNKIDKKEFLTFASKYLLIEFPFIDEPINIDETIFNLQLSGYNVVLAHPERYLYYELKDYERLTNKGVLLQLNLLSITGYYSPQVKKQAEKLINADLVSFVGTDCHNMRQIEHLKECFTNPLWHKLLVSEKLLNKTL
ncbi:MAG TPA: CpsB/CapC family capsule biosynthesis tyrosine phosphatase [Flavobacteriales bacterium]|nr:CpsB/CapC family capsule biosynthesis tyrosine phosphatase [Flavobacteriales bacterium]